MSPYAPQQADDRVDAAGRRGSSSHHLWRAALLQRRRGGSPDRRSGSRAPKATHLIKRAPRWRRSGSARRWISSGTDFDTPDGTGVRDYIHVTDLIAALQAATGPSACGSEAAPRSTAPMGRAIRCARSSRAVKGGFGCRLPSRGKGHAVPAILPPSLPPARRSARCWARQPQYNDLNTMVTFMRSTGSAIC